MNEQVEGEWRCIIANRTVSRNVAKHRADAAESTLQQLREGLQREIERLKDWRNEPAETRRVDAVYLRLEQLLPHSPDGREEGSRND